ncbi:prepilin-type N-terminal cleavage/methylation domain-containing protein [Clostridium tunisiense]|uniref:prepilin-type N-terminal cleavage/methylation domain-containing protein n=1 Tax=Clostridium tunisiense TaxID=219748 RepID=UPI00030DFA92|nr:prepilin-type N-terminal cleavage/methylation domain-containing protein [Clostridium tunisiense]
MSVKKSKGFTLIEVIVSVSIISIALITIISSEMLTLKLKNQQGAKDKGIMILETTNKIVTNNLSYGEVLNNFGDNVRYITSPNTNIDLIKKSNIISLCTTSSEPSYPYMIISGEKDKDYDVVKVVLNYVINKNEGLTYVFYKGNY